MNLNDEFTFGKHKGMKLELVIEGDPHYITWCIDTVEGFELSDEARRYYHIWKRITPKIDFWSEETYTNGTEFLND